MSGRLTALRAHLRTSTQEAREAKAAGLYELEKVRLAMTGRASAGFEFAVIEAPDGLDLRRTVAATAVMEWLEQEKLHGAWEARAGGSGEDGASSYSLHISWKIPALSRNREPVEGGASPGGEGRAAAAEVVARRRE